MNRSKLLVCSSSRRRRRRSLMSDSIVLVLENLKNHSLGDR